jgi:hypothetical protein
MNAIVTTKKRQLTRLINGVLRPSPSVVGVLCVGSVAIGSPRVDSDIDALVFLDPFALSVVPGEFAWSPRDGSFRSIFAEDRPDDAIQFDLTRLAFRTCCSARYRWQEGRLHELSAGWIAYDPRGAIAELVRCKTRYTDRDRLPRLDQSLLQLEQLLKWTDARIPWHYQGERTAQDRLNAAYEYLVEALFALNRQWRPWRSRQTKPLLSLGWLPKGFANSFTSVCTTPCSGFEGYKDRYYRLQGALGEMVREISRDPKYQPEPISAAFVRTHRQLGYASNMERWNRRHQSARTA